MGNKRLHTPLYRNSKEHHHAGIPEAKFGAKYFKTCATKYAPWQARTTTLKQFVIGVNCSIFLYRNSFGANQRLALTRKFFRIVQVSHCAVRGSSSRRMFCSNGFDTMHAVCTDLLCIVCIGLLSAEFSTVNTRLGRLMLWKPVSVEYSRGSGYHKLSTCIDYLNFQPKSSTFSKKLTQKYQALSELLISSLIFSKP